MLQGHSGHQTPFRAGLLGTDPSQDTIEVVSPFPKLGYDDLLSVAAHLLYIEHGGSGLQLSYPVIMDMEMTDILWWDRKLAALREEECKRLKG